MSIDKIYAKELINEVMPKLSDEQKLAVFMKADFATALDEHLLDLDDSVKQIAIEIKHQNKLLKQLLGGILKCLK